MEIAIVRLHPTQVVVLLKLSRWTACHRFSGLAVLAAPLPSLLSGNTAAPPRSVDLCLTVRGIAGEGTGASADLKAAAVAESCCWRDLSTLWP